MCNSVYYWYHLQEDPVIGLPVQQLVDDHSPQRVNVLLLNTK